jgi:hypothetical protein
LEPEGRSPAPMINTLFSGPAVNDVGSYGADC